MWSIPSKSLLIYLLLFKNNENLYSKYSNKGICSRNY